MEKQYKIKVLEKLIKVLDLYTYRENSFTLAEIEKKPAFRKPRYSEY